ncbi:dethiobiotin synthase [Gilvimarinus sp. SDUM040013]|uniref:ATP-dependent dethiobiotin synthetase BioD n=1 Tax=Gilvimarinus gilvus TaxID=3058038 RepID=A0ABU4RVY6_9GAMM|nr:dethiobiotin synthase [Gilvimarinus sp. SDUM040013]MDO3386743.1 dethiobiotin synthase [Gilvimarinus sp. SDUM040013]MDX6848327.1 dethiobiotin synthase [Gilvimarinus sp. SDUM040013]
MNHYFVTGTDTDVGKTQVAAALLHLAAKRGLTTSAVKPIAAGCAREKQGLRNSDALALMAECHPELEYDAVNPVALAPAIAPHIAAQQAGLSLQVADLLPKVQRVLAQGAAISVVEGAGGWRVPLNDNETLADLAQQLQLPVVLVVGMRLGCISHALLTAEAIERDGLAFAGWVANVIDPHSACIAANIECLKERLPAPCLGSVPFLADPTPAAVAEYLVLPEDVG